ncbi:MAG: hypothetical protein RSC65_02060, partial [Malacoplasma sp.]
PQNRPFPGMQNPNPQNRPFPGMQNPNPENRPFPGMQNPNPQRPNPTMGSKVSQNQKSTNVNSKKKRTFKKKAFIISMSSILGIGIVGGAAVIVPLFLTTNIFKNNSPVTKPILKNITGIYDLTNYTINLLIVGEYLPTTSDVYTVYNVTNANTRVKVEINSYDITINPISNNEISLVVYDTSITSASKYEVSVMNAEPIVWKPDNSKPQPSFSIVTQPQNQIIGDSSVNSVNLSISVSAVSNGISGESLSYKWFISDDSSNWSPLENSNTSNYRYDITGLTTKKYFKCEVSYKNALTIISNVVYVEKTTQPIINISTQPTNHTIAHDADTPTLTVAASIVNANTSQLRYQWYSSNNPTNSFTRINNATSSTYKVDNATTTKKYYKCEVSAQNAQTVSSNVVYVERTQGPVTPPTPILSFRTHPANVTVPYVETTTTLTVAVDVANPTNGVQPSYKWYNSDNQNGSWSLINNATQASYTYNVSSLVHSVKKYFKCEVNYERAIAITSNVAYVQRGVPAGPTPEQIQAAIAEWNRKDVVQQTQEFNSLMANSANNEKIKNHMLKNGGMANFFTANVAPIAENADDHYRKAQNGLTEAFGKYNIDNIATKPVFEDDGNNFMSLKGVLNTRPSGGQLLPNTPKDNINNASRYLFHNISSLGTYIEGYNFYSIDTDSYEIEIQSDFTLKLTNFRSWYNFMISGASTSLLTFHLRYNDSIFFNNETLFPGLTEFVKTRLLKL